MINKSKLIETIFYEQPFQWGLRGDPHLWENLKEVLGHLKADLKPEDFNKILDVKFNEIIDKEGEIVSKDEVYFKKYPPYGMSGGVVSLVWWRNIGLPLLKERYINLKP